MSQRQYTQPTKECQWWEPVHNPFFCPGMTDNINQTRVRCKECISNAPSQLHYQQFPSHCLLPLRRYLPISLTLRGNTIVWSETTNLGGVTLPSKGFWFPAYATISPVSEFLRKYPAMETRNSSQLPLIASSLAKVSHTEFHLLTTHNKKRAEVAVKMAKRLLWSNTDSSGFLDTDRFLRAIIQLRNTPDPDCNCYAPLCNSCSTL